MAKNSPAKTAEEEVSALEALFRSHGVEMPNENVDPELMALAMAERVFGADSLDDILGDDSQISHAKDILGENIFIDKCEYQKSDYQDGSGIYAVLTVRRMAKPDESFLVTCGSTTVIAQVLRAQELDLLPMACKMTQAEKETRSGYKPLQLRKAVVSRSGVVDAGSFQDEEAF